MKKLHKSIIGLSLIILGITLFGCEKEPLEPVEIEKKVTIYKTTDSTIVFDTIIGRPYTWSLIEEQQLNEIINIGEYCRFCGQDIIDVYWGTGGTNWLRLPFVDFENNIAVNYQWTLNYLYIFAYGNEKLLHDRNYWDRLGFSEIRVKITFEK